MIKTPETTATYLTPEELTEFKDINIKYENSIFDLGLITVEYDLIKEKLAELEKLKLNLISDVKEITEKRNALNTELSSKYGDRQVDLKTGELK
jgi:undecaprenyl pyrophosphate synthase